MKTRIVLMAYEPEEIFEVVISFDGMIYTGFLPEKKGVISQGGTIDECIKELYEALIIFTELNSKG